MFLRRMLRISWTTKRKIEDKKSNETVLREADTRSFIKIYRTRKSQQTFFYHMMRRENLEHLMTNGMSEGKLSRGKHIGWTNKVALIRTSDMHLKRRGIEMRGRS